MKNNLVLTRKPGQKVCVTFVCPCCLTEETLLIKYIALQGRQIRSLYVADKQNVIINRFEVENETKIEIENEMESDHGYNNQEDY